MPKILYVSSCWPHDRAYGGQLRALQVGRALQHFGRPTLVLAGADEVEAAARERTAAEFNIACEIPVQLAPVRGCQARAHHCLVEKRRRIVKLRLTSASPER